MSLMKQGENEHTVVEILEDSDYRCRKQDHGHRLPKRPILTVVILDFKLATRPLDRDRIRQAGYAPCKGKKKPGDLNPVSGIWRY